MRLTLAPMSLHEVPNVIKWKSDEKLCAQVMSTPVKLSNDEAIKWINKNSVDKNQVLRGIVYTEGLNAVSTIGIARLMFIDYFSLNAEVGLYIGEDSYQGKGLGVDILSMLIKLAFEELKLKKVYSRISQSNVQSQRLFLKLGFTLEGNFREGYYNPLLKKYEDIMWYSLLKGN